MKKIIALLLMLAVLSGCQYGGLFQSKGAIKLPEVRVGTQGVELFLTQNSPPPEVYEDSQFNMLVTLSNLGASDVDDGVFSVSYEPQYVYLSRQQNTGRFEVRGKSEFNPQGAERQVNLFFTSKPLGPQLQGYTTTIAFNACYPYTTTSPLIVCVDTDMTGKKTDKVCTSKPQSFPGGQGAPVAVTMVEPRFVQSDIPGRVIPEFTISMKNVGKGEVITQQYYPEACSGKPLGAEGWGVVGVAATLSDYPMKCSPETIKLKMQGDTKIVCRLEEGIDNRLGTYTAPLYVIIDYGYMTSITTQVKIARINR